MSDPRRRYIRIIAAQEEQTFMTGITPMRYVAAAAIAAGSAVGLTVAAQTTAQRAERTSAGRAVSPLTITVLSGRPDMVTGGDALVRVSGADSLRGAQITVNGRDVSGGFRGDRDAGAAGDSRTGVVGLVTGLPVG